MPKPPRHGALMRGMGRDAIHHPTYGRITRLALATGPPWRDQRGNAWTDVEIDWLLHDAGTAELETEMEK